LKRSWLTLPCAFSLVFLLLVSMVAPTPGARASRQADDLEPRELEAFQGYLDPAPTGMDIRYAWTLPGGHGENVRIVDIEFNWNLSHNDLAGAVADPFILVRGTDPLPQFNINHGTAVLGELVASPDGIGVTGIAYGAQIGLINPVSDGSSIPRVADAINLAARRLDAGDVILLEQQSIAGPRFDASNGRGLLPIEFDPGVFDAIRAAVARGIVVIEPASNGFENLDDPIYKGAFDRTKKDSGAIFVGSAFPPEGIYGPGPDRVRTEDSNYGGRLDVQGWGRYVTTCGYGDLRREQGENNWYTINFGGTSSAAAMVAGAVAVLQSIVKERGLSPLTPAQVRQLLGATGSPQKGDCSQNIGPRPDLRAAIAAIDSGNAGPTPRITAVVFNKSNGRLTVDGESFVAGDSIIEIDGARVRKLKYPTGSDLCAGTATRIMSKKNVSGQLPADKEVEITVFTPSTGKRSEPFPFRNQ
jgi:subtilisin family serine protease